MQGITGSPLLNLDMDDDDDAYRDINPRRWDEDARWGDRPEPSEDSGLRTPDSPEAQVRRRPSTVVYGTNHCAGEMRETSPAGTYH